MSPATQSEVVDPSSPKPGLLVDVALVGVLCVGVIAAWSWGAGHSEISGDSFMALDCGFRFGQGGFARPSQPLFGWGLCALSAPLFWGADSMWDVALRRAIVGGTIVPLSYLTVRLGLPLWVKTDPWPIRIAALAGALVVARNEVLGHVTTSGGHGYFALPLIAAVLFFFVLALSRRRPALAIPAFALVPLAMMNHPYASWLVVACLPLLTWMVVRRAWLSLVTSIGVALGVAWPRVSWLLERARLGDSFAEITGGGGNQKVEGTIGASLLEVSTLPLSLGAAALVWVAWSLFRRDAAGRSTEALVLVVALGASIVGWVLAWLGIGGYVRDYHLLQLFPVGLLGLTYCFSEAWKVLWNRTLRWLGGRRGAATLVLGVVLTFGLLRIAAGPAEAEPPPSLTSRIGLGALIEPWRTPSTPLTKTAAGNHYYLRSILADLHANVAPDQPVLVTNFNGGVRREDSSVALGLSLHLAGLPAHRMACCHEGQAPPVWYYIVDTLDSPMDYRGLASIDGVDLLASLPGTDELLVALRTKAAREEFAAAVCASGGSQSVEADYYLEWLNLLHHRGNPGFRYPGSPMPRCPGA